MNEEKVLQMLGMAMRAGKIVSGDDTVLRWIRSGKYISVLIAADASDNSKKKFMDKCKSYEVQYHILADRYKLGHAIGKGERVILGITDEGFARQMQKMIQANAGVIE